MTSEGGDVSGEVLVAERLGGDTYLYTQIADGVMLVVQADGENATRVHDRIGVVIDGRVCHLFKQDGSAVAARQAASARRHQGSDRARRGLTTGRLGCTSRNTISRAGPRS